MLIIMHKWARNNSKNIIVIRLTKIFKYPEELYAGKNIIFSDANINPSNICLINKK